jgi:hypothetical protein
LNWEKSRGAPLWAPMVPNYSSDPELGGHRGPPLQEFSLGFPFLEK